MAALYRVPWGRRALYIELPQLEPYLLSGCSAALGLAWKSGVAAEVIGVAEGSIGEKLYESKIYFLTADLLAWTVVIVLLSAAFEKLVVLALRRGFRRLERL
jgi:NitT/TauT family transport system permease protein